MKRLAVLAAALMGSTAVASAADLYVAPVENITFEPAAFNWTGVYVGIHGGFAGDRFDYPFLLPIGPGFTGQFDLTSSGFFGGGQVGGNWQIGRWVLGAEADIAWSDMKGELGLDVDVVPGESQAGSKVNWFGTIRGRIGFLPTDRLMIYGTGGAAYGETESYLEIGPLGEISASDTSWGWSAGGGFEYAVTDNITFKTEYMYIDLGSQELLGPLLESETHFHSIKAGVNFLYGAGSGGSGGAPIFDGPFNWSRFFAGVNGGFGGYREEYPFFIPIGPGFSGEFDLTSSGFFAGGQVGGNVQMGSWVIGATADIAWSEIEAELGLDVDQVPGESQLGSKINYFGTIRGRLGFLPTGRVMLYGTGGAAYGETEAYAEADFAGLNISTSETNWGWTAGGGVEVAITDNITLQAEYLYVDLGSQALLGPLLEVDSKFHTVKGAVNLYFP